MDFLCAAQLPHGEFPADRYESIELNGEAVFDSSPFTTTFAVCALALAPGPEAAAAVERGVRFLIADRRDPGVWSYWSKRNALNISPDADVTSCVAYVVRRFAPDQHLDAIDPILLSNATVRGRFKTWLRQYHDRNDVSPCVNANVLLYLGDREETRRAAEYLTRLVVQGKAEGSDWYYADPNALYYMISRAYREGVGSLAPCVEPVVEQISEGVPETALSEALALCALTNFSRADAPCAVRLCERLLRTQAQDGGWAAAPFYAGPEPPAPHRFWWGSRALTTAFALEALARYVQMSEG